jgi:hypothetical protein
MSNHIHKRSMLPNFRTKTKTYFECNSITFLLIEDKLFLITLFQGESGKLEVRVELF